MSNGYLTSVAFVIASLITIMFYSKKNVINIETTIFKKMLFCNLLESLTTTLIVIVAMTSKSIFILKILNRIDVIVINLWCSLIFYYIYSISCQRKSNLIKKGIIVLNIIIAFFALFLDVTIIIEHNILNSTGPLTYLALLGASLYILFMIFTLLIFKEKEIYIFSKKYIPFFFLLVMLVMVAFVRIIKPEINLVSIVLSLIDMIMIFTIENPDVKMVNELTLAKNELEKANRIKSDFLSSMSHEIRTPLNAIVGFSELAKYADTLEEAKENSDDLIEASNNLLSMFDKMFQVLSLESEVSDIKNEQYNLVEELEKVVGLYEERIKEKGIKLEKKFDSIPILIGDKNLIQRIIINVLDNAYRYTKKGVIKVIAKYINGEVKIIIEDTGIGIKKSDLSNLFIPFNKSSDTKNTNYSGMGLGLSITKNLVDKLNGSIKITSEYKKGTKVIIKIKQKEAK